MKINIRRAKLKDIDLIFRLGKKTKELQFSNKMNFHDKVELKEFISKPKYNVLLIVLF